MNIPIRFKKFDKNNEKTLSDYEHTYAVIVEEHWPGDKPSYHLDVATPGGNYIDDFWDTENDWIEGKPDYWHVIGYAPLDECWERNPMEVEE